MRADDQEPSPEKCGVQSAVSNAIDRDADTHAGVAQGDACPKASRLDEVKRKARDGGPPDTEGCKHHQPFVYSAAPAKENCGAEQSGEGQHNAEAQQQESGPLYGFWKCRKASTSRPDYDGSGHGHQQEGEPNAEDSQLTMQARTVNRDEPRLHKEQNKPQRH